MVEGPDAIAAWVEVIYWIFPLLMLIDAAVCYGGPLSYLSIKPRMA